jgi:hypothetical protein
MLQKLYAGHYVYPSALHSWDITEDERVWKVHKDSICINTCKTLKEAKEFIQEHEEHTPVINLFDYRTETRNQEVHDFVEVISRNKNNQDRLSKQRQKDNSSTLKSYRIKK